MMPVSLLAVWLKSVNDKKSKKSVVMFFILLVFETNKRCKYGQIAHGGDRGFTEENTILSL
jgi:hypothetical protein